MTEQSWGEALGSLRRKLGPEMSDTLGIPEPQREVEVAGWIVSSNLWWSWAPSESSTTMWTE